MPLSEPLKKCLAKGQFPGKSSTDLQLWDELITAMEANLKKLMAEVKALYNGVDYADHWGRIEVNGVDYTASQDETLCLLGAAHGSLMTNFDDYNTKGGAPVQGMILRLRALALRHNLLDESKVQLGAPSSTHGMGTSLTTKRSLTFLPDPALDGPDAFGSQPDSDAICLQAPLWDVLRKRRHVGASGRIGKGTHYVLAHLLNHQCNGSGAMAANVVAFAADANKLMAKQVEGYLKELLHNGIEVRYTIKMAKAVGMTKARREVLDDCRTTEQEEIVRAEALLPSALIITLEGRAGSTWKTIVSGLRIDNIVPLTVPVI